MNNYFVVSTGLFLGMMAHILIALQTINSNSPKANFKMVWTTYWEKDYLLFVISVVGCIIYLFIMNEWLNLSKLDSVQPGESAAERILHGRLSLFTKTMSVVIGAFSDYLVFKFWSKTKKAIDKKFDEDEKGN